MLLVQGYQSEFLIDSIPAAPVFALAVAPRLQRTRSRKANRSAAAGSAGACSFYPAYEVTPPTEVFKQPCGE